MRMNRQLCDAEIVVDDGSFFVSTGEEKKIIGVGSPIISILCRDNALCTQPQRKPP